MAEADVQFPEEDDPIPDGQQPPVVNYSNKRQLDWQS